LTDLPLTDEIRNQDEPDTVLPAQLARQPEPETRVTAPTFVPVLIDARIRAVVEAEVRRFAEQSATFG
jgi:hypothetical protein